MRLSLIVGSMIKILIADDHPIVRQGLSKIISKVADIEVSAEAQTGREVLEYVRKQKFDVVVLDISFPDISGLEILKQIKQEYPKTPVLILSMHPEEQYAVRAYKTGASGYLSKQSASDEMIKAIRQVASGGIYVCPKLTEKLALDIKKLDKPLLESLSNRELEVMRMIATGKQPGEIAEKLYLKVKTVNTYRERIMEKLGLKSNAEIVRFAIENNLLE